MSYSVLGEMLIVFLLIVNSGRILFLKYERIDTLAVLSPVALIIAVLQIAAWNADFSSVLLLVISFFSLLTNLHALSRSAARLYVDHYSPVFIIFSALILMSSIFAGFVLLKYAPVNVKPGDYGVTETKVRLTGTFADGFSESGYTDRTDAQLYIFAPQNVQADASIVIVGCDKRADAAQYKPYMVLLAREGYIVMTADFSASDGAWFSSVADSRVLRRFVMILSYFRDKEQFGKQKDFYTFAMIREYKALEKIAAERFGSGRRLFVVSDGMTDTAAADIARQKHAVKGRFALDSIPEYKSAGFGCVEQTDPLLASVLGLQRDKTLFIPRYLVLKTCATIRKVQK